MSTLYNNNNSVSSSFNNMASSYSIGSANQMAPPSNGPISSIELGNLSKSWCVNGNNSTLWPQQAQNRLRMCNNNECVLRTNNEGTKMDSFQNQSIQTEQPNNNLNREMRIQDDWPPNYSRISNFRGFVSCDEATLRRQMLSTNTTEMISNSNLVPTEINETLFNVNNHTQSSNEQTTFIEPTTNQMRSTQFTNITTNGNELDNFFHELIQLDK